jgi:YegS/Rv2252/BmrU family lipid kinase
VPRVLLITNPAAARTDARAVLAVRDTLRSAGWRVEVLATAAPGDARRFAAEAATEGHGGFDALLSVGGDGTAMQVAAGLVGSGIPLGLVAGGTGNILARNLRLPIDPVRAARAILKGAPYAMDLGRVARSDGEHFFAVCAGTGYDAQIMAATDAMFKRRWKIGAYFFKALALLPQVKTVRHRVTVDGQVHTVDAAMVLIANCRELVPRLVKVSPAVWPNDGIFDVMALRADGVFDSVVSFLTFLRTRGGIDVSGRIWRAQGRTIKVEVPDGEPRPVQLDGELAGGTPFDVEVVPGAVTILVDPATVPGGMGKGSSNGR